MILAEINLLQLPSECLSGYEERQQRLWVRAASMMPL